MDTKKKRPIAYIAGPVTGDPDYKEKFDRVERDLKKEGYIVLNPAILPPGMEYEQYIEMSDAMLGEADCIFLLPGWGMSAGARNEVMESLERDIEIRDWPFFKTYNAVLGEKNE